MTLLRDAGDMTILCDMSVDIEADIKAPRPVSNESQDDMRYHSSLHIRVVG